MTALTKSQRRILAIANREWQSTRWYVDHGFQRQSLRLLKERGYLEFRMSTDAEGKEYGEWRRKR